MPQIVAVIPARGGSKRIPQKNIIPLHGKPLIAYTIEAALAVTAVNRVIVTTDDRQIEVVATTYGAEVIRRPANLARDTASTESALLHVLDTLDSSGYTPDWVLTLQPTSPLRTTSTIEKFIGAFTDIAASYDAMLSVHEVRTDFWRQVGKSKFERLFPDAPRRSQEREPLWAENSALYMTKVTALRETGFILGKSSTGYGIDAREAVDINEPLDLLWAEFLLAQHNN